MTPRYTVTAASPTGYFVRNHPFNDRLCELGSRRYGDVPKRQTGDDSNRQDALRRLSFGSAVKLARPDLFRYNAEVPNALEERRAARLIPLLGPDKCPSHL